MFIKRVLLILMACLMLLGCSEAKDAANDNSQQSNVEGSGDTDSSSSDQEEMFKEYMSSVLLKTAAENGVVADDSIKIEDTRRYSLKSLTDYFGNPHSYSLSSIMKTPLDFEKYQIGAVNRIFPITVFREMDFSSLYDAYSVYPLTEGGYYYVFWGISYEEEKAILFAKYARHFDNSFVSADAFKDVVIGSSTLEEIVKIDPEMEFDSGVSWGPFSAHLISGEETLVIKYMPGANKETKETVWLVRSMDVYQTEEWGGWIRYVKDQDLP